MKEKENRVSQGIESSLKNLRDLLNSETVLGKPLDAGNGEYIIPFFKINLFTLSAGGEYGKISIFKKGEDLPFSAGGGSVVSIKPCGFLVKKGGEYKILSAPENSYEKLIEKTAEIIKNLNGNKND